MNEQNLADPGKISEIFDQSAPDTSGAAVAKALRLEAQIDETPPNEGLVQEAPMGQTIIYNQDSMGETVTSEDSNGSPAPWPSREEAEYLRTRWDELQGRFADEPRLAVEQADKLVAEVIEKITARVASEQQALEDHWKQSPALSTEDLRQVLQHYRTFFNRLLMQTPV